MGSSYQMFNLGIVNILRLIRKIMKYCHNCLTPINRYLKEEWQSLFEKELMDDNLSSNCRIDNKYNEYNMGINCPIIQNN